MDKLLQETTNITARYRCMGFVSLPSAGKQTPVLGSQRKDCFSLIVFSSISMSSGIVYLVQSNNPHSARNGGLKIFTTRQ